jgi:hypothetical protein
MRPRQTPPKEGKSLTPAEMVLRKFHANGICPLFMDERRWSSSQSVGSSSSLKKSSSGAMVLMIGTETWTSSSSTESTGAATASAKSAETPTGRVLEIFCGRQFDVNEKIQLGLTYRLSNDNLIRQVLHDLDLGWPEHGHTLRCVIHNGVIVRWDYRTEQHRRNVYYKESPRDGYANPLRCCEPHHDESCTSSATALP